MNEETLLEAISEASRFISKADKAVRRMQKESLVKITGCKETAAARRASMDLTRVLSELRKGR